MRAAGKFGLLGGLYVAQGLPFGFFTQALPVMLREEGMSLPLVGATSALALPWALKFLWAPLVDRYGSARLGKRRTWILPIQALSAAVLVLASLMHPTHALVPLVAAIVVVNLLSATQDIATDGLAVDLLAPEERGLGNGIQVAGYRVGMIIGGGALLVSLEKLGWTATLLVLAALVAAATAPVWIHREPPTSVRSAAPKVSLSSFVRREGALSWLALIAAYKFGEALGSGMVRPLLVDQGLSLEQIGWLLGGGGFTAGLVGALVGGWSASRFGRRPSLLAFGVLQSFVLLAYVLPAKNVGGINVLYAAVIIEHLAGGMATAALFTAMMDVCRPESAASDYTVQASVVVIATGIASSVSGFAAQALGYADHFVLAALLSGAGVLLVAGGFGRRGTLQRKALHQEVA